MRSQSGNIRLDVRFSDVIPALPTPYSDAKNWRVQWKGKGETNYHPVYVAAVLVGTEAITLTPSATDSSSPVVLTLPVGDPRLANWMVSFRSDGLADTTTSFSPTAGATKTSCDKGSQNKPALCPPDAGATPDMNFAGTFIAGGGTNPLYSFDITGGYVTPWKIGHNETTDKNWLTTGINIKVEINQNVKPPVHRTTFNPDSITTGLGFTHFLEFPGRLNGMRIQVQPGGEFSRTDPSSNFITSSLATFDLAPWLKGDTTISYFTLYPFIGFEVGRNLNRPTLIDKVAVDLTNYKGIARGFTGADAKFGIADKTKKDILSVTGTYRLRLPAIDEPFVETLHQVTTVAMTTKARHWVEGDIAYTVPAWKYLSITASYQYGELPPLFSFVDHKFTFGLKLQAVQTGKPAGSKLVQ